MNIEEKLRKLKPKTAEELDEGVRRIMEQEVPRKLRITTGKKHRTKEKEKGMEESKKGEEREGI